MLTEAEKKWLEERRPFIHRYMSETFCRHCDYSISIPKGWACDADNCPTDKHDHDYKDAAEFEARVAAKLAMRVFCHHCPVYRPCKKRCDWERLKYARLAVEEEMEK